MVFDSSVQNVVNKQFLVHASANETTLGRKVVVKVLPQEMAVGISIERFKREILLAARPADRLHQASEVMP